jgi:hypothetical protein
VLQVLEALGLDGMSSDETEYEEVVPEHNQKVLHWRHKAWLNPAVAALWKDLHAYEPHPLEHHQGPPCMIWHPISKKTSKREVPKKLPANFYDPMWLRDVYHGSAQSLMAISNKDIPVIVGTLLYCLALYLLKVLPLIKGRPGNNGSGS